MNKSVISFNFEMTLCAQIRVTEKMNKTCSIGIIKFSTKYPFSHILSQAVMALVKTELYNITSTTKLKNSVQTHVPVQIIA